MELGSSPCDENCAQLGSPDYYSRAMEECGRYKKMLEEKFPPKNPANRFGIKGFNHDFGRYYEVVVFFNDRDGESMDFAYNVEANLPQTWKG